MTAFSSSRSTSSSSVPLPAAVTRMVSAPEKFTAPAWTAAPAATARRVVSPVTRLSSISDVPDSTTPSAGNAIARPDQQPVAGLAAPPRARAPAPRHRSDARIRPSAPRGCRRPRASCAASRDRARARTAGRTAASWPNRSRRAARVLAVSTSDMPSASDHAERDRHVHVELRGSRDGAPGAAGRTAGPHRPPAGSAISAESQWKKSRVSCAMSAAPDHTETDSSMMFIAAKPATARHLISQRAWRASSASARSGSNGWAR